MNSDLPTAGPGDEGSDCSSRWESDLISACDWDPVAGVAAIRADMGPDICGGYPTPTPPAMPGPLGSRIVAPPTLPGLTTPFTRHRVIADWATDYREHRMLHGNRSAAQDDSRWHAPELRSAFEHLRAEEDREKLSTLVADVLASQATTKARTVAAPHVPPPLPERIQIGHATYTVATSPRISDDSDAHELAGWSDEASRHLEITTNGAHDYVRETLLHEILHQCLRVTGTDPDADAKAGIPDVEERALMGMAGPLLGVLRDHPELIAYLTAPAPRAGAA